MDSVKLSIKNLLLNSITFTTMLQETTYICSIEEDIDSCSKVKAFEKFKKHPLFLPNEKYILICSNYEWKVFKLK